MDKQICGNCKWNERENIGGDYVCVNDESDYCADWTEYDHTCDYWEGK